MDLVAREVEVAQTAPMSVLAAGVSIRSARPGPRPWAGPTMSTTL